MKNDKSKPSIESKSESKPLYHGSSVIVRNPEIIKGRFAKDFGYGFYCTEFEHQALIWCKRKQKSGMGYISIYTLAVNDTLNYKRFAEDDEWLNFVVNCRKDIPHKYDIVEGPMADDKIFNFVDSFVDGDIPRSVFWEMMKFNKPTHQISFHTSKALSCLTFETSKEVRV